MFHNTVGCSWVSFLMWGLTDSLENYKSWMAPCFSSLLFSRVLDVGKRPCSVGRSLASGVHEAGRWLIRSTRHRDGITVSTAGEFRVRIIFTAPNPLHPFPPSVSFLFHWQFAVLAMSFIEQWHSHDLSMGGGGAKQGSERTKWGRVWKGSQGYFFLHYVHWPGPIP